MKRSKDKLFNGRPLLSENLINFGNAFTMAAKMGLLSFENIKLKKKNQKLASLNDSTSFVLFCQDQRCLTSHYKLETLANNT